MRQFLLLLSLIGELLCLQATLFAQEQDSLSYDDERIYLIHSDILEYNKDVNPDAQILYGDVVFKHKGATLYCDSAHYYEKSNSFEAFENVKIYQGDTISLFSDYAFYDGNEMMCLARYNVVLKDKGSTLYTDSLNYDRLSGIGYYFDGGELEDSENILTSDWGEYNTNNEESVFNYNVVMTGENYIITSDTLYYDRNSCTAHVTGPSIIYNDETNTVHTTDGYYNTESGKARLYERSVVDNKEKIIIADTIYYDKETGISEGFGNVIYTDTINKNGMNCDYAYYDDTAGYGISYERSLALATDSVADKERSEYSKKTGPVLFEYSSGDTLWVYADTFRLYSFNLNTDSLYRMLHAYHKVRAYRTDVQAVCDSMVYDTRDSCLTMYRDPIVWSENQQLLGEVIKVYMNDSTVEWAHIIDQCLSVELMSDSIHYNQVASKEMFAYFENGDIYEATAVGNVQIVYHPIDDSDSALIGLNYTETTKMRMFIENKKMSKIWMPRADGTLYPMSQIPPEKRFLPNFVWFDYVRPLDKDDIFSWRGKKAGTELKTVKRREAPLQTINKQDTVSTQMQVTEQSSDNGTSNTEENVTKGSEFFESTEPFSNSESPESFEVTEPSEGSEPFESMEDLIDLPQDTIRFDTNRNVF